VDETAFATSSPNRLCRLATEAGIDFRHDYGGTLGGEPFTNSSPDAAASSCYDGHLAQKFHGLFFSTNSFGHEPVRIR
jgi:hypothetical protein